MTGRDRTCPGNNATTPPSCPQKELAESKHQYSMDELKHRENLIQAQLDDERAQQEELEKHKVLCWEDLPPASPCPGSRTPATAYGSM